MNCLSYDTKRYFLLGARICFGIWLLYVGATKWIFFGPDAFSGLITGQFDKTWSPHLLNVILAWLIMIAEPVFALWLLTGKAARLAWSATAALMFLLTFGQTMLMKPEVSDNWQYVVFALACAALADTRQS